MESNLPKTKKDLILDWHKIKAQLDENEAKKIYCDSREVWWASIGVNIGHEEDGKNRKFGRPVLIIKRINQHLIITIPLTSKVKLNKTYYYKFIFSRREFVSVIISQIRLLSSKRLFRKIGVIDKRDFVEIKKKIDKLFK